MTTFDAIGIASTGLTVHRKWLDAISDNIANVNTVRSMDDSAFQARYVEVQEGAGTSGAYVKGAAFGSAAGRVTYDPENPLANAQGYVRMPDIDLGTQMADLIMAQRGYQANAAVVDRAKTAYEAALQIGKN
ncbi:flagellar basal body protein [Curtobacterium sp. C1]|uniref:Flagellar basal-body rod protein FlgC n=1 Tax=Curtobacterium citreum TaxID=2036 RepID=A0A850DT83_9MICO|nr:MULTISPECIES: flagellar basal body rod C-terminal domain-containing protein [Curtobacterium]MCS5487747.1 flagellar basal body protein [Curtobacterium flaccumfaciens pv. basellae]NUU28554.1 flagellar basal-body rod protein FlgC [Curtobacterium albidum]KTR22403.1 flagellar basal body rod protein FlgG [Curtobacterium citreum]MDK8172086.1 flagellar basal body rod C-terminal domain-containing protein [Curtobacterium citreum]QKS14262.1 flagellar basal-body rod protein FlgC [Curtobacterium sp. csp